MRPLITIILIILISSACRKEDLITINSPSGKTNYAACFDSFYVNVDGNSLNCGLIGQLHNEIIEDFPSTFGLSYDSCSQVNLFLDSLDRAIFYVHPSLYYIDTGVYDCAIATDNLLLIDKSDSDLSATIDSFVDLAHDTLVHYNFISQEESDFLEIMMDSMLYAPYVEFCSLKMKWDTLDKSGTLNGLFSGIALSVAYHSTEYWNTRLNGKMNLGIFTIIAATDVFGAYAGAISQVVDKGTNGSSKELGKAALYGAVSSSVGRYFIRL